jgi:hypothetical protein
VGAGVAVVAGVQPAKIRTGIAARDVKRARTGVSLVLVRGV